MLWRIALLADSDWVDLIAFSGPLCQRRIVARSWAAGNSLSLKFLVPGGSVSSHRRTLETRLARKFCAEIMYGWKNEQGTDV